MRRWDALWTVAASQGGYFTLRQAKAAGYSAPLVEHHVGTGRLQRVGRGVFRVEHFPIGEYEDLIVAWLWTAQVGVFSHETALELHRLSDALPAVKDVTVPESWRRRRLRVPRGIILHYGDLRQNERTWLGPIPLTTPLRTVVDCTLDDTTAELVAQAKRQGIRRRLFSRSDLAAALAHRRSL